ncbi:Uncharacterized protein Adt_46726 [Abeliophyllum distichum]|uniref:Uncharacterized protein n=1 Tax=Abeliophyllum distichum TaxID=126358 RepID=A0ABD1NZR7_9LAMI
MAIGPICLWAWRLDPQKFGPLWARGSSKLARPVGQEWLAHDLDHTCSQRSSQIDKGRSKAKLVPMRPNTSAGDEVEPQPPPPSEFQFMPTPGIGLTKDALVDISGPSLTMPTPCNYIASNHGGRFARDRESRKCKEEGNENKELSSG